MNRLLVLAAALVGFLAAAAFGDDDLPVYNKIPAEKLEKILTGMKIEFKKVPGKNDKVDYYDLKRDNGLTIKMHNYQGEDLWLECVFSEKLKLDDVNRWNQRSKYSRAVMLKQDDRATVSLESQLDCLGGVTDAMVRAFVTRFDTDVAAFTKFAIKK